jgi:periplasmic protein TonB
MMTVAPERPGTVPDGFPEIDPQGPQPDGPGDPFPPRQPQPEPDPLPDRPPMPEPAGPFPQPDRPPMPEPEPEPFPRI